MAKRSRSRGIVALTSGGIDSTVMTYLLAERGYPVMPLFVDYGQRAAVRELAAVEQVLPPNLADNVEVIRIPGIGTASRSRLLPGSQGTFWMPHRNLFLLSTAAMYAAKLGLNALAFGIIKEGYLRVNDADARFVGLAARVLSKSARASITIVTPVAGLTKADVLRLARVHKVPIEKTWSCYLGGDKPCGRCPACVQRASAAKLVGG